MTTLVLSARTNADNQRLWREAVRRGWSVQRVTGPRCEPIDDDVVLYVEPIFAPSLCADLGVSLIDPGDDWLPSLPFELVNRRIELTTVAAARRCPGPVFVKPPNDKSFVARVYGPDDPLPCDLAGSSAVLVAEAVEFVREYRAFVHGRTVQAISPYIRNGQLSSVVDYAAPAAERAAAHAFLDHVLNDRRVPDVEAVVIDVGCLADGRWAVVEANGCWGSGLYGCDAAAALDVIAAATISG